MRALGYHARGKPAGEEPRTFAKPRKRHRPDPPKAAAGSPFAALAGINFERR
jgi:hypothetical protein